MTLFYKEMKSPVGQLKLVASSNALIAVLWEEERPDRVKLGAMSLDPEHPILIEAERQISEYFVGERIDFDLPLQATNNCVRPCGSCRASHSEKGARRQQGPTLGQRY